MKLPMILVAASLSLMPAFAAANASSNHSPNPAIFVLGLTFAWGLLAKLAAFWAAKQVLAGRLVVNHAWRRLASANIDAHLMTDRDAVPL